MRSFFAAALAAVLVFVCLPAGALPISLSGAPPPAVTYAALPTCNAAMLGARRVVTNANTQTAGEAITGTGAYRSLSECDGAGAWRIPGGGGGGGGGSGDLTGLESSDESITIGSPGGPVPDLTLPAAVMRTDATNTMAVGAGISFALGYVTLPVGVGCALTSGQFCVDSNGITGQTSPSFQANIAGTNYYVPTWTGFGSAGTKRVLGIGTGNTSETTTATATPTASAIPLADGSNKLADGWLNSTVTLDTEWDTAAEINAATTDTDFVTLNGVQTITGAKTISSKYDFGGGTLEVPNSTSLPGTCGVGETYEDTDAPAGQRLYLCESTNTWAIVDPARGCPTNYVRASDGSGGANCVAIPDDHMLLSLSSRNDVTGHLWADRWVTAAGDPNAAGTNVACAAEDVYRLMVWRTDTTPDIAYRCISSGAAGTARFVQVPHATSACAGYPSGTCLQLADYDGDGNVADDLQRIINTLFWPSGSDTANWDVYVAAPLPGAYRLQSRVVACADTSVSAADNSLQYNSATSSYTENAPDCTGTTGGTPTLHFVGNWAGSRFFSTAVLNTTAQDGYLIEFGNAYQDGTTFGSIDGVAALGDPISSGELRVEMESRLTVVQEEADYSGNPAASAPNILSCNGCRGHVMFGARDAEMDTTPLGGLFYFASGQDFVADIDAHTSDSQADGPQGRYTFWLGPTAFSGVRLKWNGYRAGGYVGGASGSGGGGTIIIEPNIVMNRADAVSAIQFQRWDRPTIENAHIEIRKATNGLTTTTHALDFSVSGSAAAPQKFALIRNGTFECQQDSATGADGCIELTGCGTSIQSRYRMENSRIVMNGDSFPATGSGGIAVADSSGGACTGVDLAPIVELSSVTFQNTGAGTSYLYSDDTSASANRKGFYIAAADMGGEWRDAVILTATDLASEKCLNLTEQDPAAGDELLACTDERTKVYAWEDTMMLIIGVRVSNGGSNLTAGDGCAIYPRINGTSESGTNGIAHTLVTGQTGVENNGAEDWVFVNRPVTAGQTLQVGINDSLGADNVAGGSSANADEQCQNHVGSRVRVHFARMGPPKFGTTPFGAGN